MSPGPRLRTAHRRGASYPCGLIPKAIVEKVASELAYIFATKTEFSVEGKEWEQIYSRCVDGTWDKSNNKLEDITKGQSAWSAKTVSATRKDIHQQSQVNLISGRNSTIFSYDEAVTTDSNPVEAGKKIIEIWNKRVRDTTAAYVDFRTIVLIKGKQPNNNCFAIFEIQTGLYNPDDFSYRWNTNKVLEIVSNVTGKVKMKWQPTGSQFTIIEDVPICKTFFSIDKPNRMSQSDILEAAGFTINNIHIERQVRR